MTFPDSGFQWKEESTGLTLVQFTVMPDGTMADFERVVSCGYVDLDQMAVDAVKNGLTEKWIPGMLDGKTVAVRYYVPVRFKAVSDPQ